MLIASKNPKAITDKLSKEYTLKGVSPPEYFLGANIARIEELEKVLTMGSGTIYKQLFGGLPPNKIYTSLDPKDYPELDKSTFLDQTGI